MFVHLLIFFSWYFFSPVLLIIFLYEFVIFSGLMFFFSKLVCPEMWKFSYRSSLPEPILSLGSFPAYVIQGFLFPLVKLVHDHFWWCCLLFCPALFIQHPAVFSRCTTLLHQLTQPIARSFNFMDSQEYFYANNNNNNNNNRKIIISLLFYRILNISLSFCHLPKLK